MSSYNPFPGMPEAKTTPKALAGITVIDFTHVLSGPFCTMMLADQGARVIKIEHPDTGDDSRAYGPFYDDNTSVYFWFVNRGKESIAVDLKDPQDLALVRRMLAKADVVVENFRPGTMTRLGLDPGQLVKEFPRLIVCSISGFGQYGPLHQAPAYDTVVQALSGIMSVTGEADGPPTRVGSSIADLSASVFAYAAIATALAARERTGNGTVIDVALLDGLFSLMEHSLMDVLARHINPYRIGNRHPSIAPFDTFQCRDRVLAICCGTDKLFDSLCVVLGLLDLARDERFNSNKKRVENYDVLKPPLESALSADTADVWKARLEASHIPVGLVQTVTEAKNMPQVQARNMIETVGGRQVPGSPFKSGAYDSACAKRLPPQLNEHGETLRLEFAAD
jgi:CoA:oxalate CoA-transferase